MKDIWHEGEDDRECPNCGNTSYSCRCDDEGEDSDTQSNITAENFPVFKSAYKSAVKDNRESFVFDRTIVITKYAKYLVEYLESKFELN
tara:strand:- start:37926 stop:38192 length:267 start_codon:yes stop_codon:yes gene_type:complete